LLAPLLSLMLMFRFSQRCRKMDPLKADSIAVRK